MPPCAAITSFLHTFSSINTPSYLGPSLTGELGGSPIKCQLVCVTSMSVFPRSMRTIAAERKITRTSKESAMDAA
jgi:hypothetical protein